MIDAEPGLDGAVLRELLDVADSGLLVVDPGARCLYANARAVELLGGGPLVGAAAATDPAVDWLTGFAPADASAVRALVQSVAAGGAPRSDSYLIRSGGGPVAVRVRSRRAQGAAQVLIDITAAGDAPQPNRRPPGAPDYERLLALLRVMPCGVLIVDARGRIALLNEHFCELFALSSAPQEWVGRPEAELMRRIDDEVADSGFLPRLDQLVQGRLPVTEEVVTRQERIFERDYLPVFEDGAYSGHVWMYWDFTERKAEAAGRERRLKAEITAQQLGVHAQRERAQEAEVVGRALAEENRALAAIDALRAQLLATSSHELRTPLTSILSFADLLLSMTDAGDERAPYLEIIDRNAKRLLRLVNDLLLLTRLGSGAEELELVPVNLVPLIMTAVQDAARFAAARRVLVEFEHPSAAYVVADATRAAQVVDNLLSNAIKYSRDGGTVTVRITEAPPGTTVEFIDRGIGIPAAEQPELFGQFFRASTARSSGVPGTGLGLAIVKSIVALHHGSIDLLSREGHGTTARLVLPAAAGTGRATVG